jgi:hypothetical protein
MDFSFPHSQHVYGLPEHASSLALKNTIGAGAEYTQPYVPPDSLAQIFWRRFFTGLADFY